MLYVVIGIFVLLGLVTFGLAMRGGSREEGGAGQHLVTLGIIVTFVFGLVVPTLVLADNGEHKASVAVGGVHLNKEEQKGRELFAHTCAVCHTLAAVKSVGRTGPDLDIRVGDDISTVAGRRAQLHALFAAHGAAAFHLEGRFDAEALSRHFLEVVT